MPENLNAEYRLGQIGGSLQALIEEVRVIRKDVLARIEQHDRRDDERFNSHNVRLTAIEQKLAIDEAETAGLLTRRDGWRFLLTIGSSSAVGAVISWMLERFNMVHR